MSDRRKILAGLLHGQVFFLLAPCPRTWAGGLPRKPNHA